MVSVVWMRHLAIHLQHSCRSGPNQRTCCHCSDRTAEGHPPRYRNLSWLNLKWYCVPLHGSKFILGRSLDYIQWNPNREHLRPMPEWAVKQVALEIGATKDEIDLLYQEGVFKAKNIEGYRYGKAWVPEEVKTSKGFALETKKIYAKVRAYLTTFSVS